MDDFRIWGRIEHTAPGEFVVIVTLVPESTDPAGVQTLTATCQSRAEATAALSKTMARMGQAVAERGDRVINTEMDLK